MRVAMFEGYDDLGAAMIARHRRLSGFGELSSSQLSLADDALEAVRRGRSFYEFWKPSVAEIEAMRGWLGDPRVGNATLNVYLEKAREAMGPAEWNSFLSKWAAEVNAARKTHEEATERSLLPEDIRKPIGDIASVGKWVVVGLVAYAVIKGMSFVPSPRRK